MTSILDYRDSGSYYRVITNTATHYSPHCSANVRKVFPLISAAAGSRQGRVELAAKFGLCAVPADADGASMLRYFVRDAFDELAMGNYPWASSYIAGSATKPLPAWPMERACNALDFELDTAQIAPDRLFAAVRRAVSVLYNVSGQAACFDLPQYPTPLSPDKPMDGIWDWQWCTEQMPDSYWFSTDGVRDMFWHQPYNQTLVNEHCRLAWGISSPRVQWISQEYGGRHLTRYASNLVFSSGGCDGWSSAGIATNITAAGVHSIFIPDGGHHLDLMFSHPSDPPSVREARRFELEQISSWVDGFTQQQVLLSAWGDAV